MSPLTREMVKYFPQDAEHAMWFDWSVNPNHQLSSEKVIEVLNTTPLPFDECAVCFQTPTDKRVFFVFQEANVIDFHGFQFFSSTVNKTPPLRYRRSEDGLEVNLDEGEVIDKQIMTQLAAIAGWLISLNEFSNAQKPVIDRNSFIGKKRLAKGKTPLFTWNTVVIGGKRRDQSVAGGTHASPRLHDRRGHLRHYKSGKTVWVRACKVGNAELGVVYKDYKVVSNE